MNMRSRVLSEFFGTTFLLMIICGSGIMGDQLSERSPAITLLVNSLATGAGLFVLIGCLAPFSGAHLNPLVSMVDRLNSRMTTLELTLYITAQLTGALIGVLLTHAMFDLTLIQTATKARAGTHLFISECIATFGLIGTIALTRKKQPEFAALTIAAYITSAYWFTSSTSFANPAVTLARAFTDTFCGIAPDGVFMFSIAQIAGAGLAFLFLRGRP